ncbi:hypothetical protein Ahy_B02g060572 isoform A [Arachis hypogaea]|uniref:Uncharacterized protein n=1 Tax=Arachis hypogaea TaxID=3818 RepID=A0A445AIX9_ARAHY|nr:hypothetical protein Ahy_B02g060572 isoform A [Arachis hypogaea]
MQSLELEERIPKSSNCLSLWIRSTPKSRDSERNKKKLMLQKKKRSNNSSNKRTTIERKYAKKKKERDEKEGGMRRRRRKNAKKKKEHEDEEGYNTYFPLEELHEELKEKGTTSDVGSCRRSLNS